MKGCRFHVYSARVILPPGNYLIGDPCYAFEQDTWGKICHLLNESNVAMYMRENTLFSAFAGCTAYGDGCYKMKIRDLNGNPVPDYPKSFMLGVDAGLLGVVNTILLEKNSNYGFNPDLMFKISVRNNLIIDYKETGQPSNGKVKFSIRVDEKVLMTINT